jgi:hypothetical protein
MLVRMLVLVLVLVGLGLVGQQWPVLAVCSSSGCDRCCCCMANDP